MQKTIFKLKQKKIIFIVTVDEAYKEVDFIFKKNRPFGTMRDVIVNTSQNFFIDGLKNLKILIQFLYNHGQDGRIFTECSCFGELFRTSRIKIKGDTSEDNDTVYIDYFGDKTFESVCLSKSEAKKLAKALNNFIK